MDSLKTIQAIIELAQKRPIVSILCLAFLILIIFSPLIITLSSTHPTEAPPTDTSQPTANDYPTPPHTISSNLSGGLVAPDANSSTITPRPQTELDGLNKLSPGTSAFSSDRYFIVVASRASRQSAIEVADSYPNRFGTEVYQTQNRWYAVTIGPYPLKAAKSILKEETLAHAIPPNSWLSTGLTPGKEWLGKVYP